ncbi:O-antigen ligase [uncultured Maribacter sp.]|uniref:O-antigen ligase family protein n=1 Tax=uncultured Maribacter sp. TaxID=431308 RepID=UPI00261CB211|nr:O-antigen ligase family protein [uncultured Maribacter sp.]
MLYYALMITSVFVIYEFITLNFKPALFIELPRQRVNTYGATFLGLFYRPRGFAEESGHMSLFFEFCIPLLIPYIKNLKFSHKIASILIVLIALILLSSSFTIFISLLILGTYFFIKSLQNLKVLIISSIIALSFILFVATNEKSRDYVDKYSNSIFKKVSLNKENNSVNDRTIRFQEAIGLVKDNFFFGIGAMAFKEYSSSASSLNMVLDLWMFSGFLGLLCLVFFTFVTCLNYYYAITPNKFGVFLALFILIIHYQIITNFWYPFLWVLFGIMQAETKKYNALKTV